MISGYKEEVKITIQEKSSTDSIEEQVKHLSEQIIQLRETVNYLSREKTRLKDEVEFLKSKLK